MFIQKRWGQFAAIVKPGTPHCGIDDNPLKTFQYEVICYMDDDGLDHDGFCFDNMAISHYFEGRFGTDNPVTISCEKVAALTAKELIDSLPKHNHIARLEVSITPFPGAMITYRWNRNQTKED